MFKEILEQWAICFSDEKQELSSVSEYLPFGQGAQSSISRNASVRLAAAMWVLSLEEIGRMFAFLQSEERTMADLVIVDDSKVTKVTKILSNPLAKVFKMVITMIVHKKPAKWMKGSIQVICDAYCGPKCQLISELVRIGPQQLGSCTLATTAHGGLKYLVPSDSAEDTPAVGQRVTFWPQIEGDVLMKNGRIFGTAHTILETNVAGFQSKPDVLAQLWRSNIQTMSEEEVASLLTGINTFIQEVLGEET